MPAFRTRGHPAALAAVTAMLCADVPHAILLVGPGGVGKSTLALDIAAGLLCTDEDRAARPCGTCRACRLTASGGHPDLHRLGPEGAGRQVVIGGPSASIRGVHDLIGELALAPMEGGARVAVVSGAHRMHEDAQAAMLKTLEEPGAGVVIILCADVEEPILPTIRSRSVRLRLGPVATREIEAILGEAGLADPPLAARLARIAGGRPGIARAWAGDPGALRAREQLTRTLLDLADARPSARLAAIRAALPLAAVVAAVGEADPPPEGPRAPAGRGGTRRRAPGAATAAGPAAAAVTEGPTELESAATDESGRDQAGRAPAAQRRRGIEALVGIWTETARDLVLLARGMPGSVRDIALLDEATALAARMDADALLAFLDRLGHATTLLAGNASPELVLDDLVLAWPLAGDPGSPASGTRRAQTVKAEAR